MAERAIPLQPFDFWFSFIDDPSNIGPMPVNDKGSQDNHNDYQWQIPWRNNY